MTFATLMTFLSVTVAAYKHDGSCFPSGVTCESFVTDFIGKWNVSAQRRLSGPGDTTGIEGSVFVGGAVRGFDSVAFQYRNGDYPEPEEFSVVVGETVRAGTTNFNIGFGSGRAAGTFPKETTVSEGASVISKDAKLTAASFGDKFEQLKCFQEQLCWSYENAYARVGSEQITFDGLEGPADSDVLVYNMQHYNFEYVKEITATGFDAYKTVLINIFGTGDKAVSWNILSQGDFIGSESKVIFNWCDRRGSVNFLTKLHGSHIVLTDAGETCTLEDGIDGGLHGCGSVRIRAGAVRSYSYNGEGLEQCRSNSVDPLDVVEADE